MKKLVNKMEKSFAVFILTHERANEQRTYQALKKQGYTGEIFLIVDDTDREKNIYIDKFGKDNVIIFNKKKEYKKTDTLSNRGMLKSSTFARNVIFEIAKEKGIKYFISSDDDYTGFSVRPIKNGSLKSWKVKNLDKLFEISVKFFKMTGVWALSYMSPQRAIGGLSNKKIARGFEINLQNFYLCDVDKKIEFRSEIWEDVVTTMLLNRCGKITITTPRAMLENPYLGDTSTSGGVHSIYSAFNDYFNAFHVVMASPDCCTINYRTLAIMKRENNFVPKLLPERWKK